MEGRIINIKDDGDCVVDTLKVTLGIPEVPFSGAQSAGSLFMMLMAADAGINYWPRSLWAIFPG